MLRLVVAGAAIIHDGGILIVRVLDTWLFPGGTREKGESLKRCLVRELSEELPNLQPSNFRQFREFFGQAPHGGGEISLTVFLVDAVGTLETDNEVKEAKFTADPEAFNLAGPTREAIAALRREGYL